MTSDEVRALLLGFPGVTEAFNMRSPVFKANGKVLARILEDRDLMLTGFTPDEVDMLLEGDRRLFHATMHFRNDGSVLANLAALTPPVAQSYLEKRWRAIAALADVAAFDNHTA